MPNRMIEFNSNGSRANGYLSLPASGEGPGIIVIQEWWGLVDHIKRVADRFAAEGFVALAPDLYHGEATTSPDQAGKLMMELNIGETEKELRGAIEYLLGHKSVTGQKVGTIGFCMGGMLSLYAATKNPQVGACVVFYGIHPKFDPDLENLKAPVLGFYAERDTFVPPEAALQLEAQLNSLGKQAEIHIFDNTDHGFFNDDRPEVYNREAADKAWQRTLAFFREHLEQAQ